MIKRISYRLEENDKELIKKVMKEKNIKEKDIANALDTAISYVSAVLLSKKSISHTQLQKLERILGITL